jgi:hypothetical protein
MKMMQVRGGGGGNMDFFYRDRDVANDIATGLCLWWLSSD